MAKANQRIKILERDLKKIEQRKASGDDDDSDDDDDDDLDDTEGIKIELEELKQANADRQSKLDEYEKNKKWNVDNMFHVKEERTIINPSAGKANYTTDGFAKPTTTGEKPKELIEMEKKKAQEQKESGGDSKPASAAVAAAPAKKAVIAGPAKPPTTKAKSSTPTKPPTKEDMDDKFIYSYHEFTEKYADVVEDFMKCTTFEESKEFLLKITKWRKSNIWVL